MSKREIAIYERPVRRCNSLHHCYLCDQNIGLGQEYHDGGYHRRAHLSCAAKTRPPRIYFPVPPAHQIAGPKTVEDHKAAIVSAVCASMEKKPKKPRKKKPRRKPARPARKTSRQPSLFSVEDSLVMAWVEYLADPRFHASEFKSLAKSPLQYRWEREHPMKETRPMSLGRAAHCSTLEPSRFKAQYIPNHGIRRETREWHRLVVGNKGRTILTDDEYDACLSMAKAVRSHHLVKPYLKSGTPEATILWEEPNTKIACKSRIDWLAETIVELKTTYDISKFVAESARLQYHLKAAFYVDAVKARFGVERPFVMIAVESTPPHDVGVFPVIGDELETGRNEYLRLLDLLRHCRETDTWPGKYDSEQQLLLPSWAAGALAEDVELNIGGESINL